MKDDAQLQRRLRSFGRHPIDADVAATHLARAGVAGSGRAVGPRAISGGIAAALVGALVVAGVGVAQRGEVDPDLPAAARPESVPPAAPPEGVPPVDVAAPPFAQGNDDSTEDDEDADEGTTAEDEVVELECTGPPPFAGTPPGDGGARAEEALELSTFRSEECPADDEDSDEDEESETEPAESEFECTGPPPFAGIPATDGQERAAEARAFAEFRATECPADDEDDEDEEPAEDGRPAEAGPPAEVGPPDHAGRPDEAGPPADVPGPPAEAGPPVDPGPPAEVPGPPADAGRPADAGPPQDPGPAGGGGQGPTNRG